MFSLRNKENVLSIIFKTPLYLKLWKGSGWGKDMQFAKLYLDGVVCDFFYQFMVFFHLFLVLIKCVSLFQELLHICLSLQVKCKGKG